MADTRDLFSWLKSGPGGNGKHHNGHHEDGHQDLPAATGTGPRVLVLSASVGTGHTRAAQAVELALRAVATQAHVRHVDVLSLSTAPFRRCYGAMYVDLIDAAPGVLGYFYDLMDRPEPQSKGWEKVRVALEKMSLRPFIQLLESEPWDLVINTHFLPTEIIANLRRNGQLDVPQVMVTTDYETHRMWVSFPCEHFFAATEEAGLYLQCFGVPSSDVSVTGIPVHPVFSRPRDRGLCLAKHGLPGDRPVVLQLSGGKGVGPIELVYRGLLDVPLPLGVAVVTGRNEEARRQLETVPVPERHHVKLFGYTDQIDELMACADLVLTKPGGLTTAETLCRGAGMVIVNPVPGQEERNSDYLLENGAAVKVNHIPTMTHKLTGLLGDPGRLAQIKANALRLGRPRAAFDVAERSLALIRPAAGRTTSSPTGTEVRSPALPRDLHADQGGSGADSPEAFRPGLV